MTPVLCYSLQSSLRARREELLAGGQAPDGSACTPASEAAELAEAAEAVAARQDSVEEAAVAEAAASLQDTCLEAQQEVSVAEADALPRCAPTGSSELLEPQPDPEQQTAPAAAGALPSAEGQSRASEVVTPRKRPGVDAARIADRVKLERTRKAAAQGAKVGGRNEHKDRDKRKAMSSVKAQTAHGNVWG